MFSVYEEFILPFFLLFFVFNYFEVVAFNMSIFLVKFLNCCLQALVFDWM